MTSTPDHIIRDIGQKLADDISAVVRRNVLLVDDQRARFIIATYGAATAIATASAACMALVTEPTTPEDAADGLWDTLRPMVIGAIGQGEGA